LPGYALQDGLTIKNKLGATSHKALEKERVPLSDGTIATEPFLRKFNGTPPFMQGPLIADTLKRITVNCAMKITYAALA
jgi:hypothetical protein